ncbi:MAG: hypothetical protein RLZZ314_103 [Bacteroidota bacterium]|jgi:hypothetical protein
MFMKGHCSPTRVHHPFFHPNAKHMGRVGTRVLLVIGVVWAGISAGCQGRQPSQVHPPSGILPRDSFVLVLAEIQVVEAAATQRTYRTDNESTRLAEAYNDVWHRTGVSAERFEQSHAWWWNQPEAMKEVLRDVVDVLRDMEVASNRNEANPGRERGDQGEDQSEDEDRLGQSQKRRNSN